MFRFNIFSSYLRIIHLLTFSCSPINGERYQAEVMRRQKLRQTEHDHNLEPSTIVDLDYLIWAFMHPIKTYKLIKSYHMVGDIPVIFFFLHYLFLIHFFIKACLLSIISLDRETLASFERIYYPHPAYKLAKVCMVA